MLGAMLWLSFLWHTGLPWWWVLIGLAVITGAYVCGHVEGAASQHGAIKAAEADGFMRGKVEAPAALRELCRSAAQTLDNMATVSKLEPTAKRLIETLADALRDGANDQDHARHA